MQFVCHTNLLVFFRRLGTFLRQIPFLPKSPSYLFYFAPCTEVYCIHADVSCTTRLNKLIWIWIWICTWDFSDQFFLSPGIFWELACASTDSIFLPVSENHIVVKWIWTRCWKISKKTCFCRHTWHSRRLWFSHCCCVVYNIPHWPWTVPTGLFV